MRTNGIPTADGKSMTWKAAHETCAASSAKYKAECAERAARLAAGEFVQVSALNVGNGATVRVLFVNKSGFEVGYEMASATYDAVGAASPEDYAKVGWLAAAPAHFNDLM